MRIKDDRQTFVGWWIRQILAGEKLQIFGDGLQVRDFNYVDDALEAMLLVAVNDAANGQIYNLGSDDPINLINLAQLLVELNGGGDYELIPFPPARKSIDIGDFYGDYRKLRSKLNWRPRVDLREGLKRTLAYYKQYAEHYL